MPVQIDMEMPRSCLDCRFCIEESHGGANCIASGIWGREICEHVESIPCVIRKKWCPLTETTDTKWHIVADGDLPPKPEIGMKKYLITKVREQDFRKKMVTELYWDGNGFYHGLFSSEIRDILAWRELPEPWEGAEG